MNEPRNGVTLEVLGITMLVPKQKRVFLPDGREPRVSSANRSVIPPHHPFVAIEQGGYEGADPAFSFSFDVDGSGAQRRFDAWLLNGHTVSIEGPKGDGTIDADGVFDMTWIVGDWKLRDDLGDRAVTTIDLSNAGRVEGTCVGYRPRQQLRVGEEMREVPPKLTARFPPAGATAIHIAKKGERNVIPLRDACTVIVGNAPLPELFGHHMAMEPDAPLTHLELLFSFYDQSEDRRFTLPLAVGHHHHAMTADDMSGLCGPAVRPNAEA